MKKPPIISIVGKSNSGKTTLIEKLVPEIKKRGYKIATIKHDVHGFDIDVPGKDSWKHAQAGVDSVVVSSAGKIAVIKKLEAELSLDEIATRYLSDVDIVITEGFKKQNKPKIEVFREAVHKTPLNLNDELVAIVSDDEVDVKVAQFGFKEIEKLADYIEREFMVKKQ
ncbi:molybdopterin-guanine dinucleotide biosynthesis protein B [Candidatus Oleimmundimicrobium sp.]|uniref:molybdopterin-guanine dinucleotide biosynthesis protein B n=1 Tax=Candidatus Oleimmundimicrobium sp. TaxID=3060597 RepID=UPI0027231E2B|nr:molybdopterin-guanine dinucleotide biosynthesis protein B [Candidatus Oleimmundimicrobium sp.]MDO8886903.1 molybdopterin-guanine dinucleotide biosynthesis protein B [Candidatus Oleimmundimicrobium sp.]